MDQDTSDKLDRFYHYFGRVAVHWGYAELALQELMIEYLGLKGHAGWLIIEKMGNDTRCIILKAAANDSDDSQELKEHILHAIKLFGICRENRNHLTHSFCDVSGGRVALLKLNNGIGERLKFLNVNWAMLEETFQAIEATEDYISTLQRYLPSRGISGGSTLPEKPPLPDKLERSLLNY